MAHPETAGIKPNERLLRINSVIKRVGLGRSTIYKKVKEGGFPKPIKLGERAIAWRESDIEEWISRRHQADF
ncbi:helix-turn-helix transcriptional regulator [Halorhodospira halophila]|uniref:Phage transcriptional regulator, AlpA n=1 Tax=Halorhodospira halophila (strain DSM 244 / SL1) TaxID=349124 RepID=A1WW70_HALHL|nr:AlpA family transcriptional regulator [Halorhodospira halophila]ABM61932.1 phage transcriptional regulator, AlpA [Halorhodospira halophila SL1]MBK1729740.1 AlpA family phage regulatory protein [Halorhodospira halophila]